MPTILPCNIFLFFLSGYLRQTTSAGLFFRCYSGYLPTLRTRFERFDTKYGDQGTHGLGFFLEGVLAWESRRGWKGPLIMIRFIY